MPDFPERFTEDDFERLGDPREWAPHHLLQFDRQQQGGINPRRNFRFLKLIDSFMAEQRKRRENPGPQK